MSSQMTSIEFATLFPATSQLTMLSAWVPAGAVVLEEHREDGEKYAAYCAQEELHRSCLSFGR